MRALDRQPTLTGPTLRLRPLRAEDWDALYAVASDPQIWALHPAHDRWQEPVFRVFFAEALAGEGAFIIEDRQTSEVIGCSRYDHGRAEADEVEIGWTFLARARWGGPVNAELKRLMLDHAFTRVTRVIFLVGETNLRSRRAMEKIGARLTDRTQQADMAGIPVTHVVYAIDRADWQARTRTP